MSQVDEHLRVSGRRVERRNERYLIDRKPEDRCQSSRNLRLHRLYNNGKEVVCRKAFFMAA